MAEVQRDIQPGVDKSGVEKIVLVGSPNVGKSVIFGSLTGTYTVVSNYPGTTVEITRGRSRLGGREYEILDTPGMYSLLPITEEERVARTILLSEDPHGVVQVADAKNLERELHMTIQLIEAGLPVILDLNLMDEAERLGLTIDTEALERELGIPVVGTVATEGKGMAALKKQMSRHVRIEKPVVRYDEPLESAVEKTASLLPDEFGVSKRTAALLVLQEDDEMLALARTLMGQDFQAVQKIAAETRQHYRTPLSYAVTMARHDRVRSLIAATTTCRPSSHPGFREYLSRMMVHPILGIPVLLLVIYGFYEFVGVLGAQVAVDWLESTIFGRYLMPPVTRFVEGIIPWRVLQDLFIHEYGIITLGLRYAIAIILPIVTAFFIAFSILEDTGYLPRLAMFVDRLFKAIGLSGRAVIPIVLGFGCATMATLVTRTLETTRERIIATFLLSLAIPCSAQMGVILALLAGHPLALLVFLAVMAANFLFIGYLTAKIMPGERPAFYMEVPPLRMPRLGNILTKTYARVEWYLREVIPLFALASVFIWLGRLIGLFDLLVRILAYPVKWIGLPSEASIAFLFGFFRRDYGAAGLYDLHRQGILGGTALLVSVVTLALFLPCIAQFSVTIKERGLKMAFGMAAFIFVYAFAIGYLVNAGLRLLGVSV